MSTKITADNGAEIQVGQLGITVDHPEGIASVWARLSPEQRSALAAALDPGTAGQWTRDDIDRALINVTSNAMNYPTPSQMLGKDSGPLRRKCVDAMCDLLGIEAEQAVDPVEELAEQIEAATRDAIRTVVDSLTAVAPGLTPPDVEGLLDQTIRYQSHTLATRVLEQEADQ